jgi:hypothetical protein
MSQGIEVSRVENLGCLLLDLLRNSHIIKKAAVLLPLPLLGRFLPRLGPLALLAALFLCRN